MKQILVIISIALFLLVFTILLSGCTTTLKPISDVKVISNIDWWVYQSALHIDSLDVKILRNPTGLFNNEALVEYVIKGHLAYDKGEWRPYIKEAQISERWEPIPIKRMSTGDILIIPAVDVKRDVLGYTGEKIPFEIKLQHIIHTGGWGQNRYEVTAGNIKKTFEIFQHK